MTVDDCGASVLDVSDVLDVVPEAALVDVVDRAVVVVADVVDVVEDEFEAGLFEQAANAKAQAGRSKRHRRPLPLDCGHGAVYGGGRSKWGCAKERVPPGVCSLRFQARPGAVPITEARSIDRRRGQ